MNNRMYRHVAAFLSLVMLIGLLAIPSLADTSNAPMKQTPAHSRDFSRELAGALL